MPLEDVELWGISKMDVDWTGTPPFALESVVLWWIIFCYFKDFLNRQASKISVSHNFVAENHRVIFELTLKRLKRKLLCFNSKYFRSVPFKTYIEMAMVHPLFKSHVTFWTKISFLEFNFKIKFLCHFYTILCFEDSEEGRYFWAQGRLDRNLAREWHNSGEMEEVNSP